MNKIRLHLERGGRYYQVRRMHSPYRTLQRNYAARGRRLKCKISANVFCARPVSNRHTKYHQGPESRMKSYHGYCPVIFIARNDNFFLRLQTQRIKLFSHQSSEILKRFQKISVLATFLSTQSTSWGETFLKLKSSEIKISKKRSNGY